MTDESPLLTAKELADYLRCCETTARRIMKDNKNGFTVRVGYKVYAFKPKVDRWLERQANKLAL